jgi:hypothetical protein
VGPGRLAAASSDARVHAW